jgi:hypothetical protein
MNQHILSIVFEATNGFLFVAITAAAVFFAAYLRRRWRAGAGWQDINLAAALLLFLLSDDIIRAPVWWYRHKMNEGVQITPADLSVFTALVGVGAGIGSVALLYLISAATPKVMRPWPWILTLAAAAAFIALFDWR